MSKILDYLKIDRPIIIFDLESTGLGLNADRVVEIAYLKIWPDGRTLKDDILLNPQINIPKESIAIHGITNEQVEHAPSFNDLASDLYTVFNGCIFSGFNVIRFDLPMLKREFLRAGINFEYLKEDIVDSSVIFNYNEPRNLASAYKFYCNKEHTNAHRALADVEVTVEVLEGQLEKYEDMRDWNVLKKIHTEGDERFVDSDRKFYWRDGQAYFSFSKFKDQSLEQIARDEPGFLNWILQSDFSDEVKNIIKKAQSGEFPKKD